jgi:hypothetical protein
MHHSFFSRFLIPARLGSTASTIARYIVRHAMAHAVAAAEISAPASTAYFHFQHDLPPDERSPASTPTS